MTEEKKQPEQLMVYINAKAIGQLSYIAHAGLYAFKYLPDVVLQAEAGIVMSGLTLNGQYPVRQDPYYFLDHEEYESVYRLAHQQSPGEVDYGEPLPISEELSTGPLPGVFYNAVPQGLLYRAIVTNPEYQHLDFKKSLIAILSITGGAPVGRVRCLSHGADPKITFGQSLAMTDLVGLLGADSENPLSPTEQRINALTEMMRHYAENSGVSGYTPKFVASISQGKQKSALSMFGGPDDKDMAGMTLDADDFARMRLSGVNGVAIIKAAIDGLPSTPVNEYMCMTGLNLSGIRAAVTHITPDAKMLLSMRFDIDYASNGRHGFEDAAALMGRTTTKHGVGMTLRGEIPMTALHEEMLPLITESMVPQFKADLYQQLYFSNLVRNADSHLRNFGLLYTDENVLLAPAYDVLCSDIYSQVESKNIFRPTEGAPEKSWYTNEDFLSLAKDMGLPKKSAARIHEKCLEGLRELAKHMDAEAMVHVVGSNFMDTIVAVATLRSMRQSAERVIGGIARGVAPGPNLTSKYDEMISTLKQMPKKELMSNYPDLVNLKSDYIPEVLNVFRDAGLLTAKKDWGRISDGYKVISSMDSAETNDWDIDLGN